jgi:hypothetical protein
VHLIALLGLAMMYVKVKADPARLAITLGEAVELGEATENAVEEITLVAFDGPQQPDDSVESLALPIAGLMSDRPAEEVGAAYARLSARAKALGSPLRAPFMTAGFMALLVIPALKLSDRGLFDGTKFEFTPAVTC